MSDRKKDLSYDNPSKPFVGVRFVLLGFDSTEKTKFRLKLLEGGGADAGNYGPDCTHVIVRNLTYNDPICVAARRDEKTLVTALWIDHSFDVGMPVDSASVMYRPPRDLDGIPGAKSLIICLTGYQRHDREDIMTMVSLMGASFSKPLVANKVTHLICYKFEGEKYQLAKKMKKIKLVNHSWLEDSLRAWELLPEDKYDKSGYELEMMEAEAKDSDEETQVIAPVKNADRRLGSALNILTEMQSPYESPSKPGFSRNSLSLSASRNLTNISNNNEILSNLGKQTDFNQSSSFRGKVEGDLTSMSRSAKQSPNTDVAKLSENSFSMKTPERIGGNAGNTWTSSADKLRGSGSFNLGGGDLDREKTPYKRPALDLEQSTSFPEKKKRTVSSGSTKSLKMSFDAKRVVGCESLQKKTERSANVSPICYLGDEANLNLMEAIEVSRTVTSGDRQECSEEPRYCKGLKTRALSCKLDAKDLSSSRTKGSTTDVEMQQSDLHSVEPLTSAANVSEVEKSDGRVELDLAKEGHTGPRSKSLGRKTLGKKMTGSRSSISKGNTTNSKGSISFHKETSTNDSARYETGVVVREGCEKVGTEKVQMDCNDKHGPLNDETEAPEESNKLELDMFKQKPIGFEARHSEDVREDKMLDVNDITGNDLECNGAVGVNITGSSESSPLEDAGERKVTKAKKKTKQSRTKTKTKASLTGEKLENFREDAQKDIPNTKHDEETTEADDKETSSLPDATEARTVKKDAKSAANENETEVNKSVSGKKRGLSKSRPVGDAREKKVTKGNWHGLTNNKTKGSLVTENVETHCGDAQKSGSKTERDEETATADDKETISLGNKSKARPSQKSKRSKDEKEKGILTLGDQKVSTDEKAAGELASKPSNKPPEIGLEMVDLDSVKEVQSNKATSEPKYFIFCGHRLQRREFQKVIRRLKGRVCRDSHQWSYQATHFIVPDPIRRTEKFFAAAASGRWILKKDYLTASNEAGKFLDELSYEWYKKCLTEDGAINLEAPRKWRLLKERTGHGAFYGMRIIIYGECIAPPLDTLKRVMKAGDGTILATSPPYTRFLQSGVDFAVVSPGMPRVDMWVQEFLRHEIPCIVPDYLVEYVCKPGYSLERHVQYNTQAWAEKSLKRLVNCMEEVVDDVTTPEDDDLACAVCGSRDRGDEMLICGNESGSAGCGIGTHIDCCDPPLADVPEEDWFCPECTAMRESTSIRKSPRKRASKSKK